MSATSPYIVSARKYRPATFQTVVGQRALTATLKNAILSGKLAQAYLFCGPRGVGKTSCARIFAKTINCLHPTPEGEACGKCESCLAIDKGSSFNLTELDAASNNSVDDIRKISEQVNIPAQEGRYRVFIIDEVHMLSNQAFNAFLKTLEEPPKNVIFILATTERHKVIPTILSRCQVYDFRRITVNDIIDHLQHVAEQEGVNAEREALGVIALKADGAMRDALSIFDQVVASTQGQVTYKGTIDSLNVLDQDYYFKLVDLFKNGDVASVLLVYKEILDKGFDSQFFINGLAEHVRNLMVSADPRTMPLLETSEELAKKYSAQAPQLPVEWYYSAIKLLNDADFNYKTSSNKRLLVELTLIRLSRLLGGEKVPFAVPDGNNQPQAAPVVVKEASKPEKPAEAKPVVQPPPDEKPVDKPKTSPQSILQTHPQTSSQVQKPSIRHSSGDRPKSFRLSTDSYQNSGNQERVRTTSFTPEQFKQAWAEFTNTHPEQRILVAAMRSGNPEKVDDTTYKVSVDHPAQKQAFETSMSELIEFLKDRLDNDSIKINITIEEKPEDDKKMHPKEFLKMAIEGNETLAKFLKAIDAELE